MTAIVYDVDMVRQEMSPVCWLACAVMILQHKRRYTPTSDLDIHDMEFRSGSVPSTDGNESMYRKMRQLGFTVLRAGNLNGGRFPTMAPSRRAQRQPESQDPVIETIIWLLRNHGPFVLNHLIGSFWYGPDRELPGDSGNAHAVVVTGIDTNRGTVYFNNPWGESNVPTSVRSIVGAIHSWEADHGSNQSLMYY